MSAEASKKDVKKEKPAPPKDSLSGSVKFNQNIDILPNAPLKIYDREPIRAFTAQGSGKIPKNLIAFMCDPALVPRWESASNYATIFNPHTANLIASGKIEWPPTGAEHFFLIFENNWGPLLVEPQKSLCYGIKQDIIMEQFLPPMIGVLQDFSDKGFAHGSLRLDNIYKGTGQGFKSLIVGEALTTPSSYLQPALYEPIERAMADPIGRGITNYSDDLYRLGVILTILLRASDPLSGMDDKQVIQEKIEKGSYAALTGKDRFTGAILELLRGIMHDDKSQRWNIEEVISWMDGQRLSPKQTLKRKKASRVFHMGGERYTRPEFIAYDLPLNAEEVPQYVEDEKLELWLKRSLEDKEMLERLDPAVASARDQGINDNYKYRLISRLSVILHPPAPIRYKDSTIHPEGFGSAVAHAYATNSNLSVFADMIDQNLVMFWLNAQDDRTVDYGSISTRFESCRSILRNKGKGFGLERCLYTLNREAPCYSQKFQKYFIKTPEDLIQALEDLAKKKQLNGLVLDRHSIAFLSVKDSRILDTYLIELNSEEEYKSILGNVWAIANLQKRSNIGPLPNLAEHMIKIMNPVLERFHDRQLRDKIQKEFDKVKKSGDISRLTAIFENVEIMEKDSKAFIQSMKKYTQIEKEKNTLLHRMEKKADLGQGAGQMAAAVAATVIGGFAMITLALIEFSNAGLF